MRPYATITSYRHNSPVFRKSNDFYSYRESRLKNYYHILGVSKTATTEEIKTAFRKLSKKLHPDVNEGDPFFVERFRDIQQAYDVLMDEQKRKSYDFKLSNLYSKGIDNDLYEALRKRKEERKKNEEQKRKEEEERLAEAEKQKADEELRWQQEASARKRVQKRIRAIWITFLLAATVAVSSVFVYKYNQPADAASQSQTDTATTVQATDTVPVSALGPTSNSTAALEKDRRLRKLNGRWKGTIYRFTTKEDLPVEFRGNTATGRFTVSYPLKECRGEWEIVRIDSLSYHFQETITKGGDSCIQGGRIVLSFFKKGQYQYSYYWPNEKTLNASGILFRR